MVLVQISFYKVSLNLYVYYWSGNAFEYYKLPLKEKSTLNLSAFIINLIISGVHASVVDVVCFPFGQQFPTLPIILIVMRWDLALSSSLDKESDAADLQSVQLYVLISFQSLKLLGFLAHCLLLCLYYFYAGLVNNIMFNRVGK